MDRVLPVKEKKTMFISQRDTKAKGIRIEVSTTIFMIKTISISKVADIRLTITTFTMV
jgi:hypothetical protein